MQCGRLLGALVMAMYGLAVLAGPGIAVGQEASPGAADLPEVAAPCGLGGVTLPADEAGWWELFAALPATVAGEVANPIEDGEDRIIASWGAPDSMLGAPMVLQVLSFPDGDFFPSGFTAGEFVAMSVQTEDTEATGAGRDGDLVWLQTETTVGFAGDKPGTPVVSSTMYTMTWGLAGGEWMFTASATTPEGLEAVVVAFVETVGTV